MGGHALKLVKTRRYDIVEYVALCIEMRAHMHQLFEKKIHMVRAFAEKESHGDMDILLLSDGTLGDIEGRLKERFKPGQMVCNGGVYSFDYKEFQIDVILVSPENWDTSVVFYDYDPSGNLMGKIAHKFGLKYGFKGLVYPYRASDGVELADISVSKDNREIFEFLGFDYGAFLRGFATKQEIFDYAVDSKYFDPQNFLMENLNSIDRKRNKHRPTYQEFLAYINAQVESGRKWNQSFEENKEKYLPLINHAFPEARIYAKIEECKAADERKKQAAAKFNGQVVMEMFPEMQSDALGKFICGFKSHIVEITRAQTEKEGRDSDVFNDYAIENSQAVIRGDIEAYYYSLKKRK